MKTVCELNKCTGCMACAGICTRNAIKVDIGIEVCNAVIDESLCVNCGSCLKKCHVNNPILCQKPVSWYQGWSKDEEIRQNSASGGFATEIAEAFINLEGIVFACSFDNGSFTYKEFRSVNEIKQMAGSMYVKSNPNDVYKKIQTELSGGKKVLFIGLPCHVAGLQSFLSENDNDNLYTADLICHGSPAPQLLKMFLEENEIDLENVKEIRFRRKAHYQVEQNSRDGFKTVGFRGVLDPYMIGFLSGLFYTKNCYECSYAKLDRVSDITLGDSWGSELPLVEQKKGISLALCQTRKGEEILKMSNCELYSVDLENAIVHNHQLSAPSGLTVQRKIFFDGIHKGNSFCSMIWKTCFSKCVKQTIKKVLIKSKIFR